MPLDPLSKTSMNAAQTTLALGGELSHVTRLAGSQIREQSNIGLGIDSLARQTLRHDPPLPAELERAIERVEDAVMPLASRFGATGDLTLTGLGAELIAGQITPTSAVPAPLKLQDVETLFNRLVAVSQGRPLSQETLPASAHFYAAVLILREFMHHLSFERVSLRLATPA